MRLDLHPYKVSVVQESYPVVFENPVQYCNWFDSNLNNNDTLDAHSFF